MCALRDDAVIRSIVTGRDSRAAVRNLPRKCRLSRGWGNIMQGQIYRIVVAVAVLASFAGVVTSAAERTSIGKKGSVEFVRPTHIGATLLQPGHYQVQHKIVEEQHYLVVRLEEVGGDGLVRGASREVARVACRILTVETPPKLTELYWTKEADGTGTVTQIRIEGEGTGHVIAIEPARGR
jgi:hypothetical protein